MACKRFEALEHTADKGIKAYGSTFEELCENAACGMFSLMADLERYKPVFSRTIEVSADEPEELLRAWLGELLYQFEVDEVLFVEFKVTKVEDGRLIGIAWGLPFDHQIEWLGATIKAVTHHGLYVRQTDSCWEAQVIFDV